MDQRSNASDMAAAFFRTCQGSLGGTLSIASLTDRIRHSPRDATLYLARGLLHLHEGSDDLAILDLSKSILFSPTALALCGRALCYWRREELDMAIGDLNQALNVNPDCSTALLCRAQIWRTRGLFTAALADMEKVLVLDPTNVNCLISRAYCHSLMGQVDEAVEDCNRALRLDPRNKMAFFNRGHARMLKAKDVTDPLLTEQALADFNEYTSLTGVSVETHLRVSLPRSRSASPDKALPRPQQQSANTVSPARPTTSNGNESGMSTKQQRRRFGSPLKSQHNSGGSAVSPLPRKLLYTGSDSGRTHTSRWAGRPRHNRDRSRSASRGGKKLGENGDDAEVEDDGAPSAMDVALSELRSMNVQLAHSSQQVAEMTQINSALAKENAELKRVLHLKSSTTPRPPSASAKTNSSASSSAASAVAPPPRRRSGLFGFGGTANAGAKDKENSVPEGQNVSAGMSMGPGVDAAAEAAARKGGAATSGGVYGFASSLTSSLMGYAPYQRQHIRG